MKVLFTTVATITALLLLGCGAGVNNTSKNTSLSWDISTTGDNSPIIFDQRTNGSFESLTDQQTEGDGLLTVPVALDSAREVIKAARETLPNAPVVEEVKPEVKPEPVKPEVKPEPVKPAPEEASTMREKGFYNGRKNGDRPTWYFSRDLAKYPTFKLTIEGCLKDKIVDHGGKRYVDGSLIVKQSDVSGRHTAVVFGAQCKSKVAWIDY